MNEVVIDGSIAVNQVGEVATLAEHQRALYYLLCKFDEVCKRLNITYYLFAGTLLGAVRHKDFIPWDDDLDVLMLRRDYELFLQEAPALLDLERFYLQKEFSEHWPMFFSKLRLNNTTCLEKYHPKDPLIHQGVYMDIFPCDTAYRSQLGRFIQFCCSKAVIAKGLDAEGYVTKSKVKLLVMMVCRFLPRDLFHRLVKGPAKSTGYVHSFLGGASKFSKSVYPEKCFERTVDLPFESGMFPAPAEYDVLLKILYGDYMKLPTEAERAQKKHALLVDLTRSYEEYKDYRDGMEFDTLTRSIR